MVAAIGFAHDGSTSDNGRSTPASPRSLKALRALSGGTRVASARRSKVQAKEEPADLRSQKPSRRLAWTADEALWLADDFITPVDRHLLGEVAARFPPQFNEDPPDRSFAPHRAAVKSLERKADEASRRLSARVPVATADLSELPRRRRIQLLGGLLAEEKEVLPRHRHETEIEPMRHVTACRARCESTVRWGGPRPRWLGPASKREGAEEDQVPVHARETQAARVHLDDAAPASQAQGPWPCFQLSLPGTAPREIFAEHEKSKPSELSQVLQQLHQRKALEEPKRQPFSRVDTNEEDLSKKSFRSLQQELQQLTSRGSDTTCLSASHCSRMADLGRQLEVRSYDLRFDQLLEALVAVGTAASHVEAASQPSVTDRLIVREHWRRKYQDLRASAKAMAEAVTAQTLNADLASLASGLKALAESGTGCQERVDGQLARLKEVLRKERVSPLATAKIAGALGLLALPGPHGLGGAGVNAREGATPQARGFNLRFMKDFAAMVMEAMCEYTEAEFQMMGWVFPTVYLDEGQMRQLLARAAEIQVGLRPLPHCDACRTSLGHVVDFVRGKCPGWMPP